MSSLVRRFVPGYDKPDDPAVRTACGKFAGWTGIFINALLFAGKLLAGLFTGSLSITADAVNNLSDASASLVTLLGFRLAEKPADEKHPYGHSRMEYFAGLAVAAIILVIGVDLLRSSVRRIADPEPVVFSWAAAAVLLCSMGAKLWMVFFQRRLGKHISSRALLAASADSRNDVITTAAVLLGSLLGRFAGIAADGWFGLLVALYILWSGIGIARDTVSPLLGEAPDETLVHRLGGEILASDKVLGVHDLIVHDYGPGRRFASAHVEIDARENVLEAHECIDGIEERVREELGVELVLHFDPVVTDDRELSSARTLVEETLREIDPSLAIHDFRMTRRGGKTRVTFDMVVPEELESRRPEAEEACRRALLERDPDCVPVIRAESDAFNDPHVR